MGAEQESCQKANRHLTWDVDFLKEGTLETWIFLEMLFQFVDGANCSPLCVREGQRRKDSITIVRVRLSGCGWHRSSFAVFFLERGKGQGNLCVKGRTS